MKADQLSQSAAFIAVKFYGLTRKPHLRSLFDDEVVQFYEAIVRSLPRPLCYYHYWLQFNWVRRLYIRSEELLLPGDLMHILARKWYISRIIDELLNQGYEQLLVLGAGFDHAAFHYTQQGIPSLELDSPRMARLKTNFFRTTYPEYPHPDIIPAQLPEQSLTDLLEDQQSLAPQNKTVIISEGFFDYLSRRDVRTLLVTLQDYFTAPALVSTHFSLDELSPLYQFVFRSSLQLVGEELQFNTSIDGFRDLLANHQFIPDECYGPEQINRQLLSSIDTRLGILDGFYVLSALSNSST